MKLEYTFSRYASRWIPIADCTQIARQGMDVVVYDNHQLHLLQALMMVDGASFNVRVDNDRPIGMNEVIVRVVE